jgi:hypothetical protein
MGDGCSCSISATGRYVEFSKRKHIVMTEMIERMGKWECALEMNRWAIVSSFGRLFSLLASPVDTILFMHGHQRVAILCDAFAVIPECSGMTKNETA